MTEKIYPETKQISANVPLDFFDEIEKIRGILKYETRQEYIVRALRVYNAMHKGILGDIKETDQK